MPLTASGGDNAVNTSGGEKDGADSAPAVKKSKATGGGTGDKAKAKAAAAKKRGLRRL